MSPHVSIVIPTYNRIELTRRCIENLLNGDYNNVTIFICDSNSVDGTNLLFQDEIKVVILSVGSDAWWSAAVNRGIEAALRRGTDYIVVMNDDIDFDQNLVALLVAKICLYPNYIVSPAQSTSKGVFLGTKYIGLLKLRSHIFSPICQDKIEVDTSNGCCLIFSPCVFRDVGLFDEHNCPHLAGDFEFQIRAAHFNYKTLAFPDILIRQQESTSYFRKLKWNNILTFKGSPALLSQYLTFGRQLFGGPYRFLTFGFMYHISYVWAIFKSVASIFILSVK